MYIRYFLIIYLKRAINDPPEFEPPPLLPAPTVLRMARALSFLPFLAPSLYISLTASPVRATFPTVEPIALWLLPIHRNTLFRPSRN